MNAEPVTIVMATVSFMSGVGAATATLIRQANRLALLEERVSTIQGDLRSEQEGNEQRDRALADLATRLARIEEKLDIALQQKRKTERLR